MGFGGRGARQKIARVVADDGRPLDGTDGDELQRFVEAGDDNFPRCKRVRPDAENRKSGLVAINAARPAIEPLGVPLQVLPRFWGPRGDGVGFFANAALWDEQFAGLKRTLRSGNV